MTLPFARLLADSAGALGHLTVAELVLVSAELAVCVAALALVGSALHRPRSAAEAAADLDEAA
jgi:hypothetical protein